MTTPISSKAVSACPRCGATGMHLHCVEPLVSTVTDNKVSSPHDPQGEEKMSGLCSKHRYGEDKSCTICYSKPDTLQEKCESCACKNYFDKAKPECYCECHSTKNDSRREGWGNFTISPKDCGMDYAPETKFKDQIIRMLDRDTRDKLLPDICREKAKYFLSIFREVQSQLTTLKEQNAELVSKVKELEGEKKKLEVQNAFMLEYSKADALFWKNAKQALSSPALNG